MMAYCYTLTLRIPTCYIPKKNWSLHLYSVRLTSTLSVQSSYRLLEISESSNIDEIRESYLSLAKKYHPDSGSRVADAQKFAQIEEAYRTVLKQQQQTAENSKKEEVTEASDFEIRHTAPQHRQYLSYEGIGYGAPSRRERQYANYKVSRAAENVTDYRTSKIAARYENTMVLKDKANTRRKTIRSAIDRLVEDLIQESMAKGEFDNLPGKGKPLDYNNYNPMVDQTTHNLNRILIENGYAPEWVTLGKEIRTTIKNLRQKLLEIRIKTGPEPLSTQRKLVWDKHIERFHENIADLNKQVHKLNMIVPSLRQQMVPYQVNREIQCILDTYKERLEKGDLPEPCDEPEIIYKPLNPQDKVKLKDVVKEIKALFSS